ncbi:MAG: helix-turn-helix transcriptional regulator [Sphingomonadales bacterium]|nr:helix-turn-helix transcriptional regulator [Sphingomonadales bacterium]
MTGHPNPDPAAAEAPGYDLIHARILRHFPEVVTALGGNPGALLAAQGLTPEQCDHPNVVTCRQWIAVMDAAATALSAPDFGLRLAERQGGIGVYGQLGGAMRNARSFGDALRYVATHNAAHSLAARVWMGATASGGHVFMGHDLLVAGVPGRAQAIEQVLLGGQLGARFLTADKAGARRVHFRHRALSDPAVYRRHFGCDVRFCRNEDGIAFEAAALDCPIVDADEAAFRHIAAGIERRFGQERPPFHAVVRGVVMQRLGAGPCSNADVGAALGLHPRTLLRRLRDEGTTFQRIKDEVRLDLMAYYLRETDLDFSRISEKLGFTEQSVMSRFARTRTGHSPSELRARPSAVMPSEYQPPASPACPSRTAW